MGIYVTLSSYHSWQILMERTVEVMRAFLKELSRQFDLHAEYYELWQGVPLEALGGEFIQQIPIATPSADFGTIIEKHREKLDRWEFRNFSRIYFTLKIEGEIHLRVGDDKYVPVPFILATADEMISTFGHVYFDVYPYYERVFNDYFRGTDSWVLNNRNTLIQLLKTLKDNKNVRQIDVGNGIECVHKGTESIYTYRRNSTDFLRNLINLSKELVGDKDISEDEWITQQQLEVIYKWVAPYDLQNFVFKIFNKVDLLQTRITPYLQQQEAVVEAGSFTLHSQNFERLRPQYLSLLKKFSQLLEESNCTHQNFSKNAYWIR